MTGRTTWIWLLGALWSCVTVLTAGAASANTKPGKKAEPKKIALIVGVQDYEVDRLKLVNARKDAQEVARVLREIGFKVHLATDPNRAEFGSVLAAFEADLEQADIGLFFYSGHGMQTVRPGGVEASNLLLPKDFRVPEVFGAERVAQMDRTTVPLDDVIRQLRQKARVGIVFLDACRDNPFAAEEIKAAQAEATAGSSRRLALSRGLSRTEMPGAAAQQSRPTPKVSQTTTTGMVIAYATAPGDVADDGVGDHSPFTKALLKHIKTPKRSIEQVLRDVATDVHSATAGAQRPWVNTSLLGGDLYLVPPMSGINLPAAGVPVPGGARAAAPGQPGRAVVIRPRVGGAVAARGGSGGRSSLPPGLGVGVGGGL